MPSDSYMDAAAVPVPDAGDDTLRHQLACTVDEHRLKTPVQCLCKWRETDSDTETWAEHAADALLPLIREHIAAAVQAERERTSAEHSTTHFEWGVRNHEGHVGLHANERSARETYEQQRDYVLPPQGLIRRTVTTLYSEWQDIDGTEATDG